MSLEFSTEPRNLDCKRPDPTDTSVPHSSLVCRAGSTKGSYLANAARFISEALDGSGRLQSRFLGSVLNPNVLERGR
jgi:hypothetical protein